LLTDKPVTVKGYVNFMCCDDTKCLPPDDEEFSFSFNGDQDNSTQLTSESVEKKEVSVPGLESLTLDVGEEIPENEEILVSDEDSDPAVQGKMKRSLWVFFFVAMLAGFAGILTPCVFPMIPMTVTFFMHDSANKKRARFQAIVYGVSIIAIYTIIGTIVAVTLGANFANFLSTHWIPNVLFFLIFMIFAASFLGAFEITLPSWMITKADKQADKGGFTGAFFMCWFPFLVPAHWLELFLLNQLEVMC